jgi:hypothetical protein
MDDLTFNGAFTRHYTHCFHDYPARMIPQVAGKLLDRFGTRAKILFDPYCGTGTSLLEALIRGINAVGTDLNPLARLIAEAKTSIPDGEQLDNELKKFHTLLTKLPRKTYSSTPSKIHGISRLDFWFKPEATKNLAYIKTFIDQIKNNKVKLFFQVAFSETVRESSNTRTTEFKLYRYDPETLSTFKPNVFAMMSTKLQRNRVGLEALLRIMNKFRHPPTATVFDFNSVDSIPDECIRPSSVDIIVTSPPYGDSHTTVAYGQYSRLSAAWLSLSEPEKIDSKLMGGKVYKGIPNFPSHELNRSLADILNKDKKRAFEVASFYADLQRSIVNVSNLVRVGGYACYVVGNRKVKGITLPTDSAIKSFFESNNFRHIDTFTRSIPNKRMPLRNSPTNITGLSDNTMINEYIVVMQRQGAV